MSEQTPDQTAGVPNLTEGAVSGLDHEELPRKPSTLAGTRTAGQGDAVNADTGEVTPAGDPLPDATDQSGDPIPASDDTADEVDGGQVQDEHDSGEEPSGDAAQEVEPTASPDNNPDEDEK